MDNCPFCQIIQKKIHSFILTENNYFMAILDIKPHAPGHSLIIPKNHYVNITDIPDDCSKDLISIIKEIILILSKKLNTNNFTIGINEGKLAGRLVDHLHIHIIPRFKDDKGGSIHSVVYNPPSQSLEEIYRKLKDES
ncbi:MAG: HIT family protein [Candidatus Parcubacteria bacterium]|nr:MAG: HIT family protein [Candidatus Parcubacteria bacterium]